MEFMTNLQSGLDELKPSLFEILSEQQLGSLLPPSLRYLLAVATHRHPRYLLRILNNFDELYAFLMLLVERYYLRTYGGSFTENFYGLNRERVLRVRGGEIPRSQLGAASQVRETLKLRTSDVWKNLAVMVGLPYLKRKLDEHYDIYAAHAAVLGGGFANRQDTLPPNAKLKDRFMYYYKWFLRKVYPSVNAAYYFALLTFNLAYLFDSSKFHSPFMWLIGTRMRRLGDADHKAIALATQPRPAAAARPGQSNSIFSRRIVTHVIGPRLATSLKILLPTSIFALKFLEWWHASDFARQLSRKANEGLELPPPVVAGLLPTPPPAEKTDKSSTASEKTTTDPSKKSGTQPQSQPPISGSSLLPIYTVPAPTPETSGLCPICSSEITNPTASPYGYVYCYVCIHKWVDGQHDRQIAFMEGNPGGEEGWGEEEDGGRSREGRWESGAGRDAVTGRKILGGTDVLRRVVV
ncbi:peroxisome assembly protein 12 [Microthyrium microscopicum]|uniref:Peroxisome assembly protein 12 n=1 Tax=Microthyrium microscopicum TaxID=703497 RepID=A0A6A6ULX9_9PEZI|nr:peroxisome assembly protein 12 [Microthyrium microscopicum]